MSWFLFIDESGHDHGAPPYEMLAGVAIQERAVREVIAQLQEAEIRCFGQRYSDGRRELKEMVLLVHSDFTTGVQMDDLVAYVIFWGFRTPRMIRPVRVEWSHLANQVARLRYQATRERLGNPEFDIRSFAYITDLRMQAELDEGPSRNNQAI